MEVQDELLDALNYKRWYSDTDLSETEITAVFLKMFMYLALLRLI